MTKNITIRAEQPGDYHRIAEIHALAFTENPSLGEAILVDVHRHGRHYDPQLSLIAEIEGSMVGHVLFTPHEWRLTGAKIRGVVLGPIAVHPDHQSGGIGGRLIEEGHSIARSKGNDFSLLLGHSTYYPRFGYFTGMFGTCQIVADLNHIEDASSAVKERRVIQGDIAQLVSMWEMWYGDTDLALFPGDSILNWVSGSKPIRSSVLTWDDKVIGYVRYSVDQPEAIRCFLAQDESAAAIVLSYLKQKIKHSGHEKIILPLHPDSKAVRQRLCIRYESEVRPWKAAMIHILNPEEDRLQKYCRAVSEGKRKCGGIIWPVEFDLC